MELPAKEDLQRTEDIPIEMSVSNNKTILSITKININLQN